MVRRRKSTTPPSDETIRVVVIEPSAILGAGVREILERESDIEVLAQVSTPAEAVHVVEEASPDVMLVNVDFLKSTRPRRHACFTRAQPAPQW